MSENEKFEVSSEWSAEAQINNDKFNKWYDNSLINNEEFWSEHGKRIDWIKPYTKVKDVSYNKDNLSINVCLKISFIFYFIKTITFN